MKFKIDLDTVIVTTADPLHDLLDEDPWKDEGGHKPPRGRIHQIFSDGVRSAHRISRAGKGQQELTIARPEIYEIKVHEEHPASWSE